MQMMELAMVGIFLILCTLSLLKEYYNACHYISYWDYVDILSKNGLNG